MERIHLTRNEKAVLRLIAMGKDKPTDYAVNKYTCAVRSLESKALVKAVWVEEKDNPLLVHITENGSAYIVENPNLRNPINWVAVGAVSSAIAVAIAVLALVVACNQ